MGCRDNVSPVYQSSSTTEGNPTTSPVDRRIFITHTVRFVSRFWTKVSQSNLCVKKNVVNNTPFFCNKMDKKSPKVILLLQNSEPFLFGCQLIKSPKVILLLHNSEPFLFGCQLKKSPKVILHLHNSEPLLSGCQLISSPALSLKFFSIQSVNFRT